MYRTATRTLLTCALALLFAAGVTAQGKRPITFDDLISLHRVSDLQFSPDGKWIAYRLVTPDLDANRNAGDIWLVATDGKSQPLQLTRSGRDSQPRFSPDGKRLAFVSTRDGSSQIYLLSLDGGEAVKLTSLSTGASEPAWSPDGKSIAFSSEVYPDCKDDACNQKRDEAVEKNKVKARVYENLLYRHWTDWEDHKRGHLFVVPADGSAPPRDLLPGADYDVPTIQRGGPVPFAWSPDSKELCFTAVTEKVEAITTNGELFTVPADGSSEPKRITTNPGFDSGGIYSPDGKFIAYRFQERAGFEADRWQLALYDRASGKVTSLTAAFDRQVESYAWTPDSKALFLNAEDKALVPIFRVSAAGGPVEPVIKEGHNGEFVLSPNGRLLVFTRDSAVSPSEIFLANADGSNLRQLTRHNAEKLAPLDLSVPEHFWFEGADNTQVHAMLVRPPAFDAAKKYPLVLLMHGGPQGAWPDAWSYRWNYQMFASPGYVVLLVNRRGSTGFGQKFTDEVTNDWGNRAYQDLMKGLDAAIAKFPFIDSSRLAAAGASYGGYMAAWVAAQSKGRFKTIICHAGVYNLESMYGATEELWFPEWEFKGMPWTNEDGYKKYSPFHKAQEFGKYKTPMLVIHGEQDYRVPYTQGLELFTALQRQAVPSRLLIFPDEGHWILKPQNSKFWHAEVLSWLAQYLK
jgi:dipeptidyl aminopeptidase/acylaminoacyl peptidase